jgi:hypothetical protein
MFALKDGAYKERGCDPVSKSLTRTECSLPAENLVMFLGAYMLILVVIRLFLCSDEVLANTIG